MLGCQVPVGCDECLFSLADSPEPMVAQNRTPLVPMTPAHTVTHGGPPPISSGMDSLWVVPVVPVWYDTF